MLFTFWYIFRKANTGCSFLCVILLKEALHTETTSISHPKSIPKGKEYLHNEESILNNGKNCQLALQDNIKLTNININPKFKWIKCPNQRHRKAN